MLAHILGVEETMRSNHDLPVNLHFVIEGEEEIGSPSLVRFLEQILHESGAPTLFGEKEFTTIERLWARPTAEVNGIGGGYEGKGVKTVIPSHAMAKLTFRLVPNQDPGRILALVKEHLRKNIPPGVELEMEDGHSGPCYLTDPHSPDGNAAQRSLHEVFGGNVALIRGGGSIPILSAFRDVLGAESLLLGLGLSGCRIHSPNENFPVDSLEAGIRLNRTLLKELT